MKKIKTRFFELFFRKKERFTEKISIFVCQKDKLCGLTAKIKTDNNQNYRYGKNNNDGRNHAPFVHTRTISFCTDRHF